MSWIKSIEKTERAWITRVKNHCGRSTQSRIPVFVVDGFEAPKVSPIAEEWAWTTRGGVCIMVGKSWNRRSLGQLCQAVFHSSYSEMSVSFEQHKYVPTLRPHSGRDIFTRRYNATVAELADHLELIGHKVWRGSNH